LIRVLLLVSLLFTYVLIRKLMDQFYDVKRNIRVFMAKKPDQCVQLARADEKWISNLGNLRKRK